MTYTARVDELLIDRFVTGPSLRLLAELPLSTVPQFVVLPEALEQFCYAAGLGTLSLNQSVEALSRTARAKLSKQYLPEHLAKEVAQFAKRLNRRFFSVSLSGSSADIRLSHQLYSYTYSEIATGDASILELIKERWLELFEVDSLSHRLMTTKRLIPSSVMVLVQGWNHAQASGTIATEADRVRGSVVVEAVLGESRAISVGQATPDHYRLNRLSGQLEHTTLGDQRTLITLGRHDFESKPYPSKSKDKPVLSPTELAQLYQKASSVIRKDARSLLIYWRLEQGKFEFVYVKQLDSSAVPDHAQGYKEILSQGTPVSPGSVTGQVCLLTHRNQKVPPGSILVVSELSPTLAQYYGVIKGLVARTGGVTAHAAVLAREAHVPVVVVEEKLSLKNGQVITINGSTGTVGIPKPSHHTPTSVPTHSGPITSATKIYSSVTNPDELVLLPKHSTDGVSILVDPRHHLKWHQYLVAAMGQRPIWLGLGTNHSLSLWDALASNVASLKRIAAQPIVLRTPAIMTLEEIVAYKTVLARHGIKRSVTTKLYIQLASETLSVLDRELQGIGVDGFFLDLEAMYLRHQMIDADSALRWLEVTAPKYLELLIRHLKQVGVPIVLSIRSEPVLERLVHSVVATGCMGVELPIALIDKARSQFYDAESHYLHTTQRYGHH